MVRSNYNYLPEEPGGNSAHSTNTGIMYGAVQTIMVQITCCILLSVFNMDIL